MLRIVIFLVIFCSTAQAQTAGDTTSTAIPADINPANCYFELSTTCSYERMDVSETVSFMACSIHVGGAILYCGNPATLRAGGSGNGKWFLLNDLWNEVRDQGECYDLCENMKADWQLGMSYLYGVN